MTRGSWTSTTPLGVPTRSNLVVYALFIHREGDRVGLPSASPDPSRSRAARRTSRVSTGHLRELRIALISAAVAGEKNVREAS